MIRPATVLLLACILPVMSPVSAQAQAANKRAEAEARSFLLACHQPDRHQQETCKQNQRDFVEMFVDARAGDLSSMRLTASNFAAPIDNPDYAGLPHAQVQACAWRVAIARLSPHSLIFAAAEGVRSACAGLAGVGFANAQARADRILQEIQTEPAQIPKWTPPPGLTTTATPFRSN